MDTSTLHRAVYPATWQCWTCTGDHCSLHQAFSWVAWSSEHQHMPCGLFISDPRCLKSQCSCLSCKLLTAPVVPAVLHRHHEGRLLGASGHGGLKSSLCPAPLLDRTLLTQAAAAVIAASAATSRLHAMIKESHIAGIVCHGCSKLDVLQGRGRCALDGARLGNSQLRSCLSGC